MTDPESRTRTKWILTGAVLVPLAIALTWALFQTSPRSPDDPSELLRRASTSKNVGEPKPTGKVVELEATSSSGAPVQARMPEFKDKAGNLGYTVQLREPMKPGEKATFKMPGGGMITIGGPKDGEPLKKPGEPGYIP
jgi:hypothetical protein